MGIEDKATYGEYYWAMQVEAQTLFAKETEKELAAMSARLMANLHIKEYIPSELAALFTELEAPAGAFLGDVGGRFVSEVADGAVSQAASPFFESMGYAAYNRSPTKKMTPQSTAVLFQRGKIEKEFFLERFRMGGFEPIEAKFQLDSMRPYPSILDLVLYSRYHGDPDNVWSTLQEFFNIDSVDFKLWEWLGLQRLSTIHAQTLYKRGFYDESTFYESLSRIGWGDEEQNAIRDLAYLLPNSMLLVQGGLVQGIENAKIIESISKGDIHPDYAQTYLDAVLTKPASQDIVAYELRQDTALTKLPEQLRKVGIHPDYYGLYQELAHQIPPVADIITMAVREAFTPDIAAKFGQYEDFPKDLELWAGKKGLSPEWSQRYWAAHWNLPSPMQGFEMLHRGVINVNELNMLLRALDVMPFWRDKLTRIAYRRLTRVDIRRMYKTGVLDEKAMYESYLEHGYTPENAVRMSEFTIRQTLATLSKFTTGDIIKAFTNRIVSRSEAISLLRMINISDEDARYIVSTAEYKRQWAFIDQQVSGIRNLYKKRVYDENDTRDKLSKLNLPADQINVLMEQWHYEKVEELDATWTTAQTLAFFKKGIINEKRTRKELDLNGYDDEHIDVYIRNVKWLPPEA